MPVVTAGTTDGDAVKFGVKTPTESTNDSGSMTAYSCTTKRDVKELRDSTGNVVAVAFHRQMDDITLDYVGSPLLAHDCVGANLNGDTRTGSAADEIYIDEVTVSTSAEGFRTTSCKMTGYYNYD